MYSLALSLAGILCTNSCTIYVQFFLFLLFFPSLALASSCGCMAIMLSLSFCLAIYDVCLSTCQLPIKKMYYPFLPFLGSIQMGPYRWTQTWNSSAHQQCTRQRHRKNSCRLRFFSLFLSSLVRLFQMNATMETVKYLSKPLAPTHELFRLCNKRLHTFIIIYCECEEFAV